MAINMYDGKPRGEALLEIAYDLRATIEKVRSPTLQDQLSDAAEYLENLAEDLPLMVAQDCGCPFDVVNEYEISYMVSRDNLHTGNLWWRVDYDIGYGYALKDSSTVSFWHALSALVSQIVEAGW